MDPAALQAQMNQALAAYQQGEFAIAERLCRTLLRQQPQHPQLLQIQGVCLHRLGRSKQALPLLKKATQLAPGHAALWSTLAEIQRQCGDARSAVASCDRALNLDPGHVGALFNRGLARQALGQSQSDAAQQDLAAAYRADPGSTAIGLALAEQMLSNQQAGEAFAVLNGIAARQALPDQDLPLLARAALASGRWREADALLAQSGAPDAVGIRVLMHFERGDWHAVLKSMQGVSDLSALPADLQLKHAAALSALAHHAESAHHYERLLMQNPDFAPAHSNALIQIQHLMGRDCATLFQRHQAWARAQLSGVQSRRLARSAERPRRLAMLSPRFTEGPPARLGLALVQALAQRDDLELHLYRSSAYADEMTARFAELAPIRDVFDLDDRALARQLKKDRIEVLLDWVGHAPGNRLAAIATRLAPLQMTWLDYFDTTAVPAMDAVITDPVLTPADTTQQFTEQVLTVSGPRWCYLPPDAPLPEPGAGKRSGPICLASFNRLAKLTDETLDCWVALLAKHPQARLLLKAADLDHDGAREDLLARLAQRGLAAERIELRGFSSYADTLAQYAEVDIALDPFPFTGCLTTCDALWMGVPVISMAQDSLVSRQGASLLTAIGAEDWISSDAQEYQARAGALIDQIAQQGWDRAALRERVARSPLTDAQGFAEQFVQAIQQAWESAPRP